MDEIRSTYSDRLDFYGRQGPRDLADEYATPLYVYNEKILRQRCRSLMALSNHVGFGVNYSVKANSNPALLQIIREEGLVVDAMSPGELCMDEMAGFEPQKILYISNNNGPAEMLHAIAHGVLLSVDSLSQLELFGSLNPGGRVLVRLNPGIGAGHHAKVVTAGKATKFGINLDNLPEVLDLLKKYELELCGINQHIGSLFMQPDAYLEAAKALLEIAATLPKDRLHRMEIIDFGGGFGIPYHKYAEEARLDMTALGSGLHKLISAFSSEHGYQGRFLVEPGRYVVAECGILLGSVTATKENAGIHYVGTDLGFNTLMRPVLYDSFHDFEIYGGHSQAARPSTPIKQTIVGNICESGDILAKDRELPQILVGDILGVLDAGAYGFSMASNYNQRFLPAEVLIGIDGQARLIRRRQTLDDLKICLEGLN